MDDAVIDRARAGDRDAMERVLESVAPSIRRFAIGMCKNDADAEDVVQDALLSIATNLDSFEGRSAFATWAFTLARTACARRRRGSKNRPAEGDETLDARPSEARSPEERAASQEIGALVARALDSLPEDYRSVLLLRDGEGLTAPEAAAVLGTSVDALKSRLHRARGALREALSPVLDSDSPRPGPDCPDVVAALSRKLEDELDSQACAQMEKHVESCRACARVCDTLKSALRACRSAPGEVPEDVKAQVKMAVAAWIDRRRRDARTGQ
jgi:RNA polymerase sigma-70 factor (ECF subfamily)